MKVDKFLRRSKISANEFHLGNIGDKISTQLLDNNSAPINVSPYSITWKFARADRSILYGTGIPVTNGFDGNVLYQFASGDLNSAGNWRYQVTLSSGVFGFNSDIGEFRVYGNI